MQRDQEGPTRGDTSDDSGDTVIEMNQDVEDDWGHRSYGKGDKSDERLGGRNSATHCDPNAWTLALTPHTRADSRFTLP